MTSFFWQHISAFITGAKASVLSEEVRVNIFPNPANEYLTITCNEPLQRITVINSIGAVQYAFTGLNTKNHNFALTGLPPGMYIVKATTHHGYEKVEKLLKKE